MNGATILYNGHLITGERIARPASAIATFGGRIVAVGDADDVLAWRGPGATEIDLRGRTVVPGFNDAHCHPTGVGFGLLEIDARTPPNRSIADIARRFAERAATASPAEWITGFGYDQARLAEQRHPNRHDLDAVTRTQPLLLTRACHHIAVANSRALQLAGITRDTPDPPGGTIDRDASGEPTGVLREAALQQLRALIPAASSEQIEQALLRAGRQFLSRGVTSVAEAGIHNADELRAYQRLASTGQLPVRSYLMMMIDPTLEPMARLGLTTGLGDAWLRIGPAKLFLDGSIGGRTARLSQPYEGEDDNIGLWMNEPAAMRARLRAAHQAGFQVCAHAIGDAAIEFLIDTYEEALRETPRPNHRHRIEHCSVLRPDLLDRIERLGLIPVPGTSFLHAFSRAYVQNLGIDRIRYTYPMRSFIDRGIVAPASSDAPVVSTNPLIGIQTMVTRHSEEGDEIWPEEAITLEEAIRCYSWSGAFASFEEDIKGTLTVGKLADLAVLETDLRTVESDALGAVQVDLTMIDGEVVYERS